VVSCAAFAAGIPADSCPQCHEDIFKEIFNCFHFKSHIVSFCGRKSGVLRKYGCINQIRHHQNFFTMSQASVKTEDSWPHTHFISVQYSQSHGTEWGK